MFSWMRHWPRQALIFAVITVVILGASVWASWPIMTAEPEPSIDFIAMQNELVAAGQPQGEDGWPALRTIIVDGLGRTGDARKVVGTRHAAATAFNRSSALQFGEWDEINRTADIAQLETFDDLLEPLIAAMQAPRFHAPYVHKGNALTGELDPDHQTMLISTIDISWLGSARLLVSLNTMAMRVAAAQGDWDEFLDHFRAGMALGERVMRQATLIEQLVGMAIISSAICEAVLSCHEFDPPPSVIDAAVNIIDGLAWSREESTRRWISAERNWILDVIQWSYSSRGSGGGQLVMPDVLLMIASGPMLPMALPSEHVTQFAGLFVEGRDRANLRINAMFDEILTRSAMPPNERGDVDDVIEKHADRGFIGVLLRITTPALDRAMSQGKTLDSTLRGHRLGLLLKRYQLQTGEWPERLEDAVSLEDSTDPISGEPFIYERLIDDESGRPFVIRIPWHDPERSIDHIHTARWSLSDAPTSTGIQID
jgi:hypothetical protein